MDLELTGKVALVTGGSRGIGKAIALELAREGVDVAICARTPEPLESAAQEITEATGRRILPITADMASREQIERMVETAASSLGAIHILVNNAAPVGGLASGPLATIDDAVVMEDLNIKFMGYLRCARATAPYMQQEGWGRIINIAGLGARNSGPVSGGPRNVAVVHLTKTLADELGAFGITVNVIHPGTTRTERTAEMVASQADRDGLTLAEVEQRMGQGNAIRRIVDAQEVAYVTAFLASPKAVAISGEVIAAGGGAGRAVYF